MPDRELIITPELRKRKLLWRELKLAGLWLVSALFPNPRQLGLTGEWRVHNCLLRGLPVGSGIWSDVLLPTPKGTVQVDLVVGVGAQVFAVEVKNRAGSLRGNAKDHKWQWKVGHRQGTLYNPVRQAQRHARVLGRKLQCKVTPLVVFTGPARVDTDAACVFTSPWKLLEDILDQCPDTLSAEDRATVQRTRQKLDKIRMEGTPQEKRAHVRHARNTASARQNRTRT